MKKHSYAPLVMAAILLLSFGIAQAQTLSVTPTTLNFNVQTGAALPGAQSFQITTTSATAVTYSVFVGPSTWAQASPTSGTVDATHPATVNVSLIQAGVPAFSTSGQIFVTSPTAGNATLTVNLNISTSPQLTISSGGLTFSYAAGATTLPAQTINVSATSGSVFFSVVPSSTGSWLAATPLSGTAQTGTNTPVTVTVDPTKLGSTPGTYQGTVTFLYPGGPATGVAVPVSVTVTANAQLTVNQSSLSFGYQIGTSQPAQQTLHITAADNATAIPFSVAVSQDQPVSAWLVASPSSAITPADVRVNVTNLAVLPAGAYAGTITLTTFQSPPQVVKIRVALLISQVPLLVTDVSSVSLNSSAAATVNLSTTNNSQVAYTASATDTSGGWLQVSPASGVTGVNSALTISVKDITLLPSGTYNGTVHITAAGTGNSPLDIPVTLTVTTIPALVSNLSSLTFEAQTTGTGNYTSQALSITSTTTPLSYTVAAATESGGSWLAVTSASSGTTPGNVLVQVNPAGLTPDVSYKGSVTLTPQGGGATPLVIPVTFHYSTTPQLIAGVNGAPGPIVIAQYQQGSSTIPPAQTILLTSTASPAAQVHYTAFADMPWFYVVPQTGDTPSPVQVNFNPLGLAPGTYRGNVALTATTGGLNTLNTLKGPLNIPVVLTVSTGTLGVSNTDVKFTQATGGAAPASQTVNVTGTGATLTYNVAYTVQTPAGGNWLTVTPTSGSTPGTLTISANGAALAPGTYNAIVTVSAPGAAGSPQTINVTLNVVAATISAAPASLTFSGLALGANPAAQTISLTSGGVPIVFTAAASTTQGSGWLSVTPASGTTGASATQLNVTVNTASLAAGTYNGSIAITPQGQTAITVPVTLTLTAAPNLMLGSSSLTFTYQQGGTAPAAQAVTVGTNSGSGIPFTAMANATWLTVTPASGQTPSSVSIGINPQNLGPGTYNGAVTISAPQTANTPQTVNVTLTVTPAAVPVVGPILNAASYAAGAVAPGEIIYMSGTNLGPTQLTGLQISPAGQIATTLADAQVLFDGTPAPLVYVSATQVAAVVPYFITGRATTRIQMSYRGQLSSAITLNVTDTAPGIFTQNSSGSGPGAILNQDLSLNGPNNPAAKGTVVAIYATGGGLTTPPASEGQVENTIKNLNAGVRVTIGGVQAPVQYKGIAPGLITGVVQINVMVPADARSGNVPVVLQIGNGNSQQTATVSIR